MLEAYIALSSFYIHRSAYCIYRPVPFTHELHTEATAHIFRTIIQHIVLPSPVSAVELIELCNIRDLYSTLKCCIVSNGC